MIFRSIDPASDTLLWEGEAADAATCAAAVTRARAAFPAWAALPQAEREDHVRRYKALLSDRSDAFAKAIARETGKPLWEAKTEIASMIGKVDISIAAQAERAGSREQATPFGRAVLRHKPHGVMAVLGPYNFPGHLPNGHIVPALLAGDVVLFKPSELTPLVGELMAQAFRDAGLPDGVFTLLQGGRDTGAALVAQDIDGLLFTGSAGAGAHFTRVMADRPGVILALELGGNNPLVAWDGDAQAVASIIVQSAFITAGQRCSCARRLILPQGAAGDAILDATVALARRLTALVRAEALVVVANKIGLGAYLLLSPGEQGSEGGIKPAILADACEAVIGALYLDAGLEAAKRFIRQHWDAPLEKARAAPPQDPKTGLQEWALARGLALPLYEDIGRTGPDHAPIFQVRVTVAGFDPVTASGPSKRAAEKAAADELLRIARTR